MPNYLYNGVELPDINAVWDKETYPYAYIVNGASIAEMLPQEFTGYLLHLSSAPAEAFPDGYSMITLSKGAYSLWYSTKTGWVNVIAETNYSSGVVLSEAGLSAEVWASTDILNTDGSVYLAASDPVPVGGEPTTRTEWQKQDAYKPNTEWNGKTFYRVMGGKWVKQDVVVPQVVEVEPDVPEPDVPDPEKPTNWLTFSSAEPFTIGVNNATKNWDGTLYYSTDTTTWSEWDGTAAIASAEHEGEQRVYMRGVENTKITGSSDTYRWVLTGSNISCNGNIENLLDFETVADGKHPTMAKYCYAYMFQGCTSLITAPELPATTLASDCYGYMFKGCTSLDTAPKLPATTMAESCYRYMFNGCTALTISPELPATTLASSCYYSMFLRCTSLDTAPKLPATTMAASCYKFMFYGCTALTIAPELPATTLAEYCYQNMFEKCINLISIPKLPATTLAITCYYSMFLNCTKIKFSETQTGEYQTVYRIPTVGTGTTASNALVNMFTGTGGTFTGTPAINTTYYTANEVV